VNLGHLWGQPERLGQMMRSIVALVADRTFAPVVDRTFSFAQAGDAHAYIQDHRNFGKVLLTPD
jgi:synaptic vesicle membrane protein VAT-1